MSNVFGGGQPNAVQEILKGFVQARQQDEHQALGKEIADREALAKRFDEIYSDAKNWDEQSRQQAFNYANQLRLTPPHAKRPKEFQPDKDGRIPAMVNVTYRKIMKDGPGMPAKPAPLQQPTMPGMPAGLAPPPGAGQPQSDQIDQPPGPGASAGMPPMPGGQQLGPNQISPAPGIPGMPTASMPPPPNADTSGASGTPEGMQSAMLTDEDRAHQQSALNTILNNKHFPPEIAKLLGLPEGTTEIDPTILQNIRLTGDRDARLAAQGISPDGARLPWKQAMDDAVIGLRSAQADAQRAIASGKPEEAAAITMRANAAMLSAQAAMERANNPGSGGGGGGSYIPLVDGQGNLIGAWNPKTDSTKGPPPVEGARKTPLPAGEIDKRATAEAVLKGLDDLETLGKKHSDKIGVLTGRWEALKVNTVGAEAEVNELFRLSDDIADRLLRARSGAAITEKEYLRLRRLVPDPRSPLSKFNSDLSGFRKEVKSLLGERQEVDKSLPPPPGTLVVGVSTKVFTTGASAGKTGTFQGYDAAGKPQWKIE